MEEAGAGGGGAACGGQADRQEGLVWREAKRKRREWESNTRERHSVCTSGPPTKRSRCHQTWEGQKISWIRGERKTHVGMAGAAAATAQGGQRAVILFREGREAEEEGLQGERRGWGGGHTGLGAGRVPQQWTTRGSLS